MAGGGGGGGEMSTTHLHDLPDAILTNVFSLVEETRLRNSMALVCHKWHSLERSTRTFLSLRGNVRHLFLLPTCFTSVTHLDLSLLSPWGHPFFHHHHQGSAAAADENHHLIALRLRQAFPSLTSLTVYSRNPSTLLTLAPHWPHLRHAKLVRFHPRSNAPLGSDIAPLLAACPSLSSLDLSHFYCWTEDLPPALQAHPSSSASLTRLNLLSPSSSEGFKSRELLAISSSCPNLRHLLASCVFNPRYIDFVGDEALIALAANCPLLTLLHLIDPSALSTAPTDQNFASEDARITCPGLEDVFASLPLLEDLALDLCHNVRDTGPAFEALSYRCLRIKSLKLGQFHGVCRAIGMHLEGVALCGGLDSLCIKNSADLTDSGLATIARGCRRLSKFEIRGCKKVTEMGMRKFAGMLRSTLVDVRISSCKHLDAARSLRALEPIRDRIERLHFDCIWVGHELERLPETETSENADNDLDLNEVEEIEVEAIEELDHRNGSAEFLDGSLSPDCLKNKKCRYSDAVFDGFTESNHHNNGGDGFWCRTWKRLNYLSIWVPAGELLTPLADAGLENCPQLEEICIKVEGDCRTCPMPIEQVFGLSSLARYPSLSKMKLDYGDAIGYALTAPAGQMDLSSWERFFLRGIGDLNLSELDYWPPRDKDVNQRSLFLPAAGLLAECATLRKLFIHGTAYEHLMKLLLWIPNLRDVQLREDYYPAPEDDMSTEMRVDSCSRFEDALNNRPIPD